ncbi:MAG: hypothetical protein ACFCVD_01045 [Nodosilinea sp.]
MSQLFDWSVSLAESAVPYEIDLAPDILEAYLEGGEAREELFKQTDTSIAGGFGSGTGVALLPFILNGIAAASKWIFTLLSSEKTSNAVSVVKDIKELLIQGKGEEAKKEVQQLSDTNPYDALKQIIDTLGFELRKSGIPDNEADLITFRVLVNLLENPEGTTVFIKHL